MPNWKAPSVPRTVVQVLPVDKSGNILLLHRSNTVRSARNVWSIPTGMQEVGESLQDTIVREIQEEFNLIPLSIQLIGIYENIAGDVSYCPHCNAESGKVHHIDCLVSFETQETVQPYPQQYHWVLMFYTALVENITKDMINKEPDKHDQTAIIPYMAMLEPDFFVRYNFHRSLTQFLNQYREILCGHIQQVVSPVLVDVIEAQEALQQYIED